MVESDPKLNHDSKRELCLHLERPNHEFAVLSRSIFKGSLQYCDQSKSQMSHCLLPLLLPCLSALWLLKRSLVTQLLGPEV